MPNRTKKRGAPKPSKRTLLKAKTGGEQSLGTGISLKATDDIVKDLLGYFSQGDLDAIRANEAFRKLGPEEKVEKSRKVIQDTIIDARKPPDAWFALAIAESEALLKGYATLDAQHRAEIETLIQQIKAYLKDPTRKRPFNALMLAAPGAGKSFFIEQLAKSMTDQRVEAVTFNMATMQSADDMAQPVDELRNVKVNDGFPLLFLDEFDSDPSRYPSLLPLLWEGELQIGHRDLKLGKAVIVLAGSNPDLPKAMDSSGKMRLETGDGENHLVTGKLVDLLSRINGGTINIPDLDLRSANRDRRVDKVCVAVSLVKKRFAKDMTQMPRSLLTFIALTGFRYGTRSIAHLVDVIASEAFADGVLKGDALDLPMSSENRLKDSSLRLHLLDKDQAFGVVNRWRLLSKDKEVVHLKQAGSSIRNRMWPSSLSA
jgi:hypothetical protein